MLKRGEFGPMQVMQVGQGVDGQGLFVPFREIIHPDGPVRVEYYQEEDSTNPTAYRKFLARMAGFNADREQFGWQTVVFDSVTSAELKSRKYAERVLNPVPHGKTKATLSKGDGVNPMQWYGASTDFMEEMLCERLAGMMGINVVIICHINNKTNAVNGEILRLPNAPGRLADRALLPTQIQEIYHCYRMSDGQGRRIPVLGTENNGQLAACSQICPPHPCHPSYEALWENWPGERPDINVLVYGDFGVGKSQFAASFPKPMVVFMFDGKGKDLPYWKYEG